MLSAQHPLISLDLASSIMAERRRADRSRDQRAASRGPLRPRR